MSVRVSEATRDAWMHRWWDFWPSKPILLQNGVGRLGCLLTQHERGRSQWCGWCGKDLKVSRPWRCGLGRRS